MSDVEIEEFAQRYVIRNFDHILGSVLFVIHVQDMEDVLSGKIQPHHKDIDNFSGDLRFDVIFKKRFYSKVFSLYPSQEYIQMKDQILYNHFGRKKYH